MLAAISDLPLSPWERGEKTRAEMAAELGVSERHLRRLLAQDREKEPCDPRTDDVEDLPYVPLVSDPDGTGPGYLLDSSSPKVDPGPLEICNVESGKVRIGGEGLIDYSAGGPRIRRLYRQRLEGRIFVRNVNGGAPVEQAKTPSKKKSRVKPPRTKLLTREEVDAIVNKPRGRQRKKRA